MKAAEPVLSTPYVGLRPYTEAERPLFFGRDRDALLLRNKILSSPITVLYALSGIGKSSLLRALVEPSLREQGAHVVYYEEWAERDPVQGLRLLLRDSIPAERRSISPTASLAAIADAACTAMNGPIVLILDQFEKLLLQRRQSLDAFSAELAALVHGKSDTHVVLSLREEFLASLDVLRSRIVTLLSSTHRLRPLDHAGVREAIVRPAVMCGGTVEEALVDALLQDLRADQSNDQPMTADLLAGHVELPFLQLVCRQLWDGAGGGRVLTLAQYEKMGKAEGIIRQYVHGLTDPLGRRQRADLARVLDLLAPRSGAKMAFAAEDLAHNAKVQPSRAAELLEHLVKSYVVRSRATTTTTWYELYHDAFIRVLRSWVDRELYRISRRRLRWRAAAAVVGVNVALIAGFIWGEYREKAVHSDPVVALTGQLWDSANGDNAVRGAAVWYLLQAREGFFNERLEELLRLLYGVRVPIQQHYARTRTSSLLQPPSGATKSDERQLLGQFEASTQQAGSSTRELYSIQSCEPVSAGARPRSAALAGLVKSGTQRSGQAQPTLDGSVRCHDGQAALRIVHGSRVTLDEARFRDAWNEVARFLIDTLGIPPPLRVSIDLDDAMHPDDISATMGDSAGDTLDLSWIIYSAIVAEGRLSADVRGFLAARGNGRWSPLDVWMQQGRLWRVPRWTMPLWHAAGQPAMTPEQLVAIAVLTEISARPEVALSRATVARLLRRAPARPRGARGHVDSVRAVLLALVRERRSIRNAPALIGVLARHPRTVRDSIPVRVWRTATEAACRLPRAGTLENFRNTAASSAEYAEVVRALPPDSTAEPRRRKLYVCIVQRLIAEQRFAAADSALDSLPPPEDSWTPLQNYLLGYWMAQRASARPDGEPTAGTQERLVAAFKHWPNDEIADSAYKEVRLLCYEPWSARQCWNVLDAVARERPTSILIALLAGADLSERPDPDAARSALDHLARAEARIRDITPQVPAALQAWFVLLRAQAREQLAEHGDSAGLGAAASAMHGALRSSLDGPTPWRFRDRLIANRVVANRLSEADSVLRGWPSSPFELDDALRRGEWEFFLHLAHGRPRAAKAVASRLLGLRSTTETLFLAALAGLLAASTDQEFREADALAASFYRRDHDYRDYVRLLHFWSLASRGDTAAARRTIADRWAQIDSSSWNDRARKGDRDVWRETLIGVYAGAVARERLERIIESQGALEATPYRFLGATIRGLQCEANFYLGLREAVTGDAATRRQRAAAALEKAVQTGFTPYYEYQLARILLERYRSEPVVAATAARSISSPRD